MRQEKQEITNIGHKTWNCLQKNKLVLGENVDLLVFCQPVAQICINLNLFI